MRTPPPGHRTHLLSTALHAGLLTPGATVDHAALAAVPDATRDAIVAVADESLGRPWPQPTLTHWRAHLRDGSRLAWEDRTSPAAVACTPPRSRWR
jgi:hypothetical protein